MMPRQRKKRWSARLLCGLAVLLAVAVASADESGRQRLRATIDVSEVFTETETPQVLTVTLNGTGTGRHFGRPTFAATERIDFRQFGDSAFPHPRTVVTDGQFTITAANGDTLTGTYDGVGLPDPAHPGFGQRYGARMADGWDGPLPLCGWLRAFHPRYQRGDVDRGDHVQYPRAAVLPWRRRLTRQALAPWWGCSGAVEP